MQLPGASQYRLARRQGGAGAGLGGRGAVLGAPRAAPVATQIAQRAPRPPRAVAGRTGPSAAELLSALLDERTLQSCVARVPELLSGSAPAAARVGPMLELLAREGFQQPDQVAQLLLKCPQVRSVLHGANETHALTVARQLPCAARSC